MAKMTAEEMAKQAGVDPRIFRQALREEKFPWHGYYERWTVEIVPNSLILDVEGLPGLPVRPGREFLRKSA
jgi:hypothetical protein